MSSLQASAATSSRQQAEAASLSAQLAAANKELDLTLVAATRAEQEKGVLKDQVGVWVGVWVACGWRVGGGGGIWVACGKMVVRGGIS